MEGLFQAKKLIEEAQNILILTAKNPGVDSLGSALSLSYTLNNVGKIVNFSPKKIPQNYLPLFSKKAVPESFVISVQGKEISELYYEKENRILKIFLTSYGDEIKKEDIQLTSLKEFLPYDSGLLVTIGIERLERLGEFYEKNFKLFYQTPILNIDNHRLNNEFGNVNLLAPNLPIAIVTSRLINTFNKNLTDKNIKSWLLAGVMEFSQTKAIEEDSLKDALALSSGTLPYEKMIEFFGETSNSNQRNLLAAVLKKIRYEKGLPFCCLVKEDFKASKTTPKDLSAILKNLTKNIFRFPTFLLLWESNVGCPFVRGVFYSSKLNETRKLSNCFEAEMKGKWIIFNTKENDIGEVRKKILKVLW